MQAAAETQPTAEEQKKRKRRREGLSIEVSMLSASPFQISVSGCSRNGSAYKRYHHSHSKQRINVWGPVSVMNASPAHSNFISHRQSSREPSDKVSEIMLLSHCRSVGELGLCLSSLDLEHSHSFLSRHARQKHDTLCTMPTSQEAMQCKSTRVKLDTPRNLGHHRKDELKSSEPRALRKG